MEGVNEDDATLLQRLWPSSKLSLRREAASLLLQDPDHRLRVAHLEVLLRASLNRDIPSSELQAELGSEECVKYFQLTPDTGCEWGQRVVKLLREAVVQDAQQLQAPEAHTFPYLATGALETEQDRQVMQGALNTWDGYSENDEDYLAVVISWVLVTKKDSKGLLPTYSLHLTDVGGFLRSLTVSDSRLSNIFPRTGGGGVFVSKRQKQTTKARPRLSEYLLQQRYRLYFKIRDSSVRKSEKVVTLAVDKLIANARQKSVTRSLLSVPALGQAHGCAGSTAHGAFQDSITCRPAGLATARPFSLQAAMLPESLDGLDAPLPPRHTVDSHHLLFQPRSAPSLYNPPAPLDDILKPDALKSGTELAPYLDPVIDQPVHPWHQRTSSLFSLSSTGSVPLFPPTTPHLTPAVSRFSSSFPDLPPIHGFDTAADIHRPGPTCNTTELAASADMACSNLMAAFRPEPTFYSHHGVEYMSQVPDVIAKCWSAPLDELMTKTSDVHGTGLSLTDSSSVPAHPLPIMDDACSDDGSVSLDNCMIPEDSDCDDTGDDLEHMPPTMQAPSSLFGKRIVGSAGVNAGQNLLKLLSTSSAATPAPEVTHVPSFAPSTPSFFPSPSQQRNMGSSTDSDNEMHSSTQSNSSEDTLESCTSPGGNFTGPKTVEVTTKLSTVVKAAESEAAKPKRELEPERVSPAPVSFAAAAASSAPDAPAPITQAGGLSNWAAIAAKRTIGDSKSGREIVFAPAPTPESKVAAAAAAAQVVLPPGAAKNLSRLSARVRDEVLRVVKTCPAMKLEDFDEGVVAQLMAKKSDEDAAAAIKSISQHDLNNIQHMAAFINFVVKNYAGGGAGATAARGSIGGLVSRASSVPVSSRTILQKLPLKVYKHLEEVVSKCSFLEWKHFDAGVVKVLSQLAKMADEDVCEELDVLLQTDLSNVEYMPAYLNKRFNNRLWSRRKVTA